MSGKNAITVFYLDDGYPESHDYDNNYVAVDQPMSRGWLRALLVWAQGERHGRVRLTSAAFDDEQPRAACTSGAGAVAD
ncbi:MAG: hypothetical protein ABIP94_11410 [Planctomycetota bacterium]